MCQPKDKGGKRCFIHMMGTMATITMASIMSGIDEKHVAEAARKLRKEGKNLPTPTEEEIVAFAKNNQFICKHDSTIPDNKRAMLVRRWQKAELERPDGGGFHAWKHTLVESVVQWKRTSMAIGLAGVIAATSACSGGNLENNSPTDTSTPTTITQTTQAPTPSMVPTTPVKADTHDNTVELGKTVKTSKGEYTQAKLPENSVMYKYSPDLTDENVKAKYSEDEIVSAQKFIGNFVAEEVIDTPLNGGGETTEQWWSRNKDKISIAAQPDAYSSLGKSENGTSNSFVAEEPWQAEGEAKNYSYVYKADTPRVSHLQIVPTKVFLDNQGGIAVNVNLDYQMPFNSATKENKMYASGPAAYSVIKNDKGDWVINGYQRRTTTKTGAL